ncbi:cell growth-regulating nucleolar protein [Centruroides vittatus]|uniref:cell growth-regulating nucleolar protein n=1 Tax=Centruroides vittatus TaxID=120091 RepID=UPI00350F7500
MVFFTCNACGQAIKKNQVEKHYTSQCRNCEVLSCMDCGKDFYGDAYLQHTQCISEEEKYGGKDFKPKPASNKGAVKQQEWIEHIKNTIATTKVEPLLQHLLEQIITYPNVPRKKFKFENFIKNCLRCGNVKYINRAWEIFDKAQKQKSQNSKDNKPEDLSEEVQNEKNETDNSTDAKNLRMVK